MILKLEQLFHLKLLFSNFFLIKDDCSLIQNLDGLTIDKRDHYLEKITVSEIHLIENFTRDTSKFTSTEYNSTKKNNFDLISSNWSNCAYTIRVIGNYYRFLISRSHLLISNCSFKRKIIEY